MTDTSFNTPTSNTSTLSLSDWNAAIEMAGGPCMPAHQLEEFLTMATPAVKESSEYKYWEGVLDAHQVHLLFGGVAA